jgi:DNA-binding response OmpR family regulator
VKPILSDTEEEFNRIMFKRIFVVEDDLDIAELLEFNLVRHGYLVSTFSDGSEAYDGILSDLPDLVILDLTLPGLTGMEICRYMRNNLRTQKIPIIILTARTAESDRLKSIKSGANKFITKPFSIKEVLTNVQDLTSRKKTKV